MILKDKVVVVTGASSGIGEQIAKAFGDEGAQVILLARDIEKLARVQKTISNSFAVQCDVKNDSDVEKAFLAVKNVYGRIDILVNNAGVGKYGLFEEQTIEIMKEQMETNYFGVIRCIKQALPLMPKGSRIVNISSILGKLGIPGMSSYVATKFAVTGLSESLQYEFQKKGIHVHTIYPAAIKTNFFDDKSFKPYLENLHSGMWTEPEKVAKAVVSAIKKKKAETYVPARIKHLVKVRSLLRTMSRFIEHRFYKGKF